MVSGNRYHTNNNDNVLIPAKKKYMPQPSGPMPEIMSGVKRAMMNVHSQLAMDAETWPTLREAVENISELMTQGVPFQEGM